MAIRKALLVGINSYAGSPLRGCVNDVMDMRDLLAAKGFQPANTRILTDQKATAQAMREGLSWLVTGAQSGDILVFHYSGHGSQVPDRNGDEADHLDECIIPVDYNWTDKIIRDDELAVVFGKVPQVADCYVVLDSCHSGTGTRELAPPGSTDKHLSRFLQPPEQVMSPAKHGKLPSQKFGRMQPRRKPVGGFKRIINRLLLRPGVGVAPAMTHTLLSGCRSDQTSADAFINNRYNGALTRFLLNTVKANPMRTMLEQYALLRSAVANGGYAQVPQIEGPPRLLNRPAFS